jgi:translation initiation factor 2 beta subunit (eIF-2beta)/eIF-5
MRVNYTTKNGRVSVELNGDTQREIFEQLSNFQEVFDETVCGKCGSDDVRFVVRNVDDNLYYELKCLDCGARLSFGTMKKGGRLFPRRKNKDGEWLPDRGWVKWNPDTKKEE